MSSFSRPILGYRQEIQNQPDRSEALKNLIQTLGTTSQPVTISIPTWAKGVRLYPVTNYILYGIDETPVLGTSGYSASIDGTSASGVGGVAVENQVREVVFQNGDDKPENLVLLATTNSSVVRITFF